MHPNSPLSGIDWVVCVKPVTGVIRGGKMGNGKIT